MSKASMEKVTTKRLSLYTGRTHPQLAQEVADHLGVELGDANIVEFANGEIRPRFADSIRGGDVFVMQTHHGFNGQSRNNSS
jgi:ribose-phosphate pyrophosphokinase